MTMTNDEMDNGWPKLAQYAPRKEFHVRTRMNTWCLVRYGRIKKGLGERVAMVEDRAEGRSCARRTGKRKYVCCDCGVGQWGGLVLRLAKCFPAVSN